MTVSTELSHEEYVGNGVTTDFDFRFRIFESRHLIVVVADNDGNETTLKNGTDYFIVGVGSYFGGKVVLSKPLAKDWKILLERDLPVVQETDLRNQGKFFAEVHEDAFDYLTMLIQKALGTFSLSLRKPTYLSNYYDAKGNRIANVAPPKLGTDAVNKDYVDNGIKDIDSKTLRVKDKPINALPNTEQRANKILAFDDNGQPITVLPESGSASDVLIELAKPAGSEKIGWRRNSVTAFLRTLDDKVSDAIHLRDFMSDEISVTEALQNAIDYIFDLNVDSNFINSSYNSGYKKLSIGGDLHLIDRSILIPPLRGGVIICDGSLKASDKFPEGEPIFKYDRSGVNSDVKYRDLYIDCNRRANGILFDLYIKNVIDNCHIFAMKDYGIKTQNIGFELMITDCFIQEYWNFQPGFDNPTSTGVIFGAGTSDNHINNTVIDSCRHPFEDYGQANAYNMLHIYGNGRIDLDETRSILGEACQFARFTSCYFDTNILEIRNPRNLDITAACKFVGGSGMNGKSFIVFKPTIPNHEVVGVNITGNQFAIVGLWSCNAFGVDLSKGSFSANGVKESRIYNNSRAGSVLLKGTKANKSFFGEDTKSLVVSFSDRLLFGANIQWLNYSINSNRFTNHSASFFSQSVTISTEIPTNITAYISVDTSINSNGIY